MTTQLETNPADEAATIAAQNDAFRRTILPSGGQPSAPKGKIVMTQGISALDPDVQQELIQRVAVFDAFNIDSDPHGWHEMGVIKIADTTIWFKIDLYDTKYQYGSPAPQDLAQTRRVLTLLLPSEY
jgi:hypothetical protein